MCNLEMYRTTAFKNYIKKNSFFILLEYKIIATIPTKIFSAIIFLHLQQSVAFYFLKKKNPYNFINYMFLIKSNQKQYFLSFLGLNVFFFNTVSTGKLLKVKNLQTKSLKTSAKANKYLLAYFNNFNSNENFFISYCLLKPINRKNLNFFYLILKTYKTDLTFIGFKNYYKVVQKKIKRIKKK